MSTGQDAHRETGSMDKSGDRPDVPCARGVSLAAARGDIGGSRGERGTNVRMQRFA